MATDGKSSSKMAISCCVIYFLPSRPVKVSQTTLDKSVEILKNLHPPTLICVGHFLSTKCDIYTNSGRYSPTHGRNTTQISIWDPSLPASTVMDHEQLHCSTDLLFQGVKVHIYQ